MKHMKKITAIIILLPSAVFLLRTPVLAASHSSFQQPASLPGKSEKQYLQYCDYQ
jgi:hypothetical protein